MEDEVEIAFKDRQTILDRIFRKERLTESKDVDVLNRITGVQNLIDIHDRPTNLKTFKKYFDNKSLPMLDAHIIKPSINGKITPNWTNNNSESANHILKSAA